MQLRAKEILYIVLLSIVLTVSMVVGVFAAINQSIHSYYDVYYTFAEAKMDTSDWDRYRENNPDMEAVIFDYFDGENISYTQGGVNLIEGLEGTDLSLEDNNTVMAYYDDDINTAYVLSRLAIMPVGSAEYMFSVTDANPYLETYLYNFTTAYITNMAYMFNGANIMDADFATWETQDVTNMAYMFNGAETYMSEMELDTWNVEKVTSMHAMFKGVETIDTVDVTGWTTSSLTDVGSMFEGCTILSYVYGFNFQQNDGFDCSQVVDFSYMFYGTDMVNFYDDFPISEWDFTSASKTEYMFPEVTEQVYVGFSYMPSSKELIQDMFVGCDETFTGLTIEDTMFTNLTDLSELFTTDGLNQLVTIGFYGTNQQYDTITNIGAMCAGMPNLTDFYFEGMSLPAIEEMGSMFEECSELTYVYLEPDSRTFPSNISYMFANCHNLTTIDGLLSLNIGSCETLDGVFMGCSSLESLDLTTWDFGGVPVQSVKNIFTGCTSLEEIIFADSTVDFEGVEDFSSMFAGLTSLKELDLRGWMIWGDDNIDMSSMFAGCTSLTTIYMPENNFITVGNMDNMFSGCSNLSNIYVTTGWTSANATGDGMFTGCTKLPNFTSADVSGDRAHAYATNRGRVPGYLTMSTVDVNLDDFDGEITGGNIVFGYYDEGTINTYLVNGENVTTGYYDMIPFYDEQIRVYFNDEVTDHDVTYVLSRYQIIVTGYDQEGDTTPFENTTIEWLENFTFHSQGMNNLFAWATINDINGENDFADWDTSEVLTMHQTFYQATINVPNGFEAWDVSNVTDMSGMFSYAGFADTILDLSGWDTSNVQSMSYMFGTPFGGNIKDNSLTDLDLSDWDTSNVTEMYCMFANTLQNLTSLNLGGWNVSNVTNMGSMFSRLSGVTQLDIADWDTPEVTDMSCMFAYTSFTELDLSSWDVTNVTNMGQMFMGCDELTTLYLNGFDTANTTNMFFMFHGCSNLSRIYVSSYWNTDNVTNSAEMFNDCINLPNFESSYVDKTRAYAGGDGLGYLSFAPVNVNISTIVDLINDQEPFEIYFGYYDNGTTNSYTLNGTNVISGVTGTEISADTSTGSVKAYIKSGNVYILSNLSITPVGDASHMFANDWSMTVNFINFNTGEITNMSHMFFGTTIKEHNIESWDVSKVTDMSYILNNSIISGDTDLDLSKWNVSNVNVINNAFYSVRGLTSLELTGWDVDQITDMHYLFANNSSLIYVDVRGWDTSNVTDMTSMFDSCGSTLKFIYADDSWSTASVTTSDSMFNYCTSLPNFEPAYTDATRAYVDGKGYLSSRISTLDISKWNTLKESTGTTTVYFDYYDGRDGYTYELADGNTVTLSKSDATDLSELADGGVLAWNADTDNGKVLIVLSEYPIAPVGRADYMFKDMTFYMNNLDTRKITYMIEFMRRTTLMSGSVEDWNVEKVNNFQHCFSQTVFQDSSLDLTNWNPVVCGSFNSLFYNNNSLTSINMSNVYVSSATNFGYMFYDCDFLTDLDISGWVTTKMSNTVNMFYNCKVLPSVDVTDWNTSNLTNANGMFMNCYALDGIDVSNWNVAKLSDAGQMFKYCKALTSIGVKDWTTTAIKNISAMFQNCEVITSLDLSGWNTNNLTNMGYTFLACRKLTTLNVAGWNTSNVTTMQQTFNGCYELTSIDVANWDVSKVTNFGQMFANCTKLTSLDLSLWNTSSATDMQFMFSSDTSLVTLKIASFDTDQVTNMSYMFNQVNKLTSLNIAGWNTSSATNMEGMFQNMSNVTTIIVGNGWNTDAVTSSNYMFNGATKLPNFNASYIDKTRAYVGTDGYLYPAGALIDLGASASTFKQNSVLIFDYYSSETEEVYYMAEYDNIDVLQGGVMSVSKTDISVAGDESVCAYDLGGTYMLVLSHQPIYVIGSTNKVFNYSSEITFNNFHTNYLTDLSYMFAETTSTMTVDLSGWDVSNVTTMEGMFNYSSVTPVGMTNWNTKNLTNTSFMFSTYSPQVEIDLSNWNTTKLSNTSFMFNMANITKLDLTNWNTTALTNTANMFKWCSYLTRIFVGDGWTVANVTESTNMFIDANKLPNYDANYVDKTRAYAGDGGYLSSRLTISLTNAGPYYYYSQPEINYIATGDNFSFGVTIVSPFTYSSINVYANGQLLTPATTMYEVIGYTLTNVTSNTTITIEDVTIPVTINVDETDNTYNLVKGTPLYFALDYANTGINNYTTCGLYYTYLYSSSPVSDPVDESVVVAENMSKVYTRMATLNKLNIEFYSGPTYSVSAVNTSISGSVVIPRYYHGPQGDGPVIEIATQGFENCKNITQVVIPADIAQIKDRAFYNCTSLYGVAIRGSKLVDINTWAFFNTTSLGVTFLPSSLQVIDEYAFYSSGITSIYGPSATTASSLNGLVINTSAFSYCSSLYEFKLKPTILGSNAFYGCTKLVSIDLTSLQLGACGIPANSFATCTSLTTVLLPSTLRNNTTMHIGSEAFRNCTSLSNFTLPTITSENSLYTTYFSMEDMAFQNCTSLTSITIPHQIMDIPYSAFKGCTSLETVTFDGECKATGIYMDAFYGCNKLKTITNFPQTITFIDNYAFKDCWVLESLTIPASVTDIGYQAFYGCYELEYDFAEGSKLVYIGPSAFEMAGYHRSDDGEVGTKDLVLPSTLRTMEIGAFAYNRWWKSVTIPATLETSIAPRAFYDCYPITQVTFAEGSTITKIEESAFAMCTRLATINIPTSVHQIGVRAFEWSAISGALKLHGQIDKYAFYNCGNITSIEFDGGANGNIGRTIDQYAFYGCLAVKFINIYGGRYTLEEYAFGNITELTNFSVSGDNYDGIAGTAWTNIFYGTTINYFGVAGGYVADLGANMFNGAVVKQFSYCPSYTNTDFHALPNGLLQNQTQLTDVWIYGSVTNAIQENVFKGCTALTNVDLRNATNLESISNCAFAGCTSLTEIIIPEGVTSLGFGLFSGCTSLTKVVIPASVLYINTPWEQADDTYMMFYNTPDNIQVYLVGSGPASGWDVTWNYKTSDGSVTVNYYTDYNESGGSAS